MHNENTNLSYFEHDLGYQPLNPLTALLPQPPLDKPTASQLDAQTFISHLATVDKFLQAAKLESALEMKKRYDTKHQPIEFAVNEEVLLNTKDLSKFKGRFDDNRAGPYRVKKILNYDTYELDLPPQLSRIFPQFHVSKLFKYHPPLDGKPRYTKPPPDIIDGYVEFEVEQILRHRQTKGTRTKPARLEFLVKWKGHPPETATWEPAAHFEHAKEIFQEYVTAHKINLGV